MHWSNIIPFGELVPLAVSLCSTRFLHLLERMSKTLVLNTLQKSSTVFQLHLPPTCQLNEHYKLDEPSP